MSLIGGIKSSLLGKRTGAPVQQFDSPIAPDEPFIAIGDIHGSLQALGSVLQQIEEMALSEKIICVGDYVDRGDSSAEVLTVLKQLNETDSKGFICLAGNHEAMLLKFIDSPSKSGSSWLKHGGLQTLASYGVAHTNLGDFEATRDALVDAMGAPMIEWLRELPMIWTSGNVAVVHAAAHPGLAIDEQPRKILLWGHPKFMQMVRTDGTWIIHGHTIVDQPSVDLGRVAIDTGAYATGRLTAVHVSPEGFKFLSSN